MPTQPGQEDANAVELTGHVATMRFAVDYGSDAGSTNVPATQETNTTDEAIAKVLNREMHQQMLEAVKFQVAAALGPGFDVESLVIRSGSIEILVAIAAVAAVLRNYNDFVEQLNKAVENTRNIVRTLLSVAPGVPRASFIVQGRWIPGTALTSARDQMTITAPAEPAAPVGTSRASNERPIDSSRLLLIWALVTTILLLGIIVAIVITRK